LTPVPGAAGAGKAARNGPEGRCARRSV